MYVVFYHNFKSKKKIYTKLLTVITTKGKVKSKTFSFHNSKLLELFLQLINLVLAKQF